MDIKKGMKLIIKENVKREMLDIIKQDGGDEVNELNRMVKMLEKNGWVLTVSQNYGCSFLAEEDLELSLWNPSFFREYDENETEISKSSEKKIKFKYIDIIMRGRKVTSIIDNSIGVAKLKPGDKFDEKFGILLSVVRALEFDKSFQNKIIDLYYGNLEESALEEFGSGHLAEELWKRLRGRID